MKRHVPRLCQLCDTVLSGQQKWYWLAANLAALLLSLLLKAAWLALPLLLLGNSMLLLYHSLRRAYFDDPAYQRLPRPVDAQCETVLIDASLLGQGTRLRAAAQPIDVAAGLSLRLGSGALLLGTAMTLTADELPASERSSILSAVNALNIKANRLRTHNPVLNRTRQDGLTALTVRDGGSNRVYYIGRPEDVAAICPRIWEGMERDMTDRDHLRIADTARYIAQGNCRVHAWATAAEGGAPVFLGMAGVGESIEPHAIQEVNALRSMGLTVMLDATFEGEADLESLRTLLDLPDYHARPDIHLATQPVVSHMTLGISREAGDSLSEPISLLRQRFHGLESTLRNCLRLMLFAAAFALLCGNALGSLTLFGLALYGGCQLGVTPEARLSPLQMLPTLAISLLARVFLHGIAPGLTLMASGILCVTVGLCLALCLSGTRFTLQDEEGLRPSRRLLTIAAVLIVLWLVVGALEGLACLLPLGFALLLSAAAALILLTGSKFLR